VDALGRRRERREIAALARGEHDGMLVFAGPAGIGKTRLLEDARAEHGGTLVRVDAAESAWPLAGISALLSSVDDHRAAEFGGRFRLRSTRPDDIFAAARDLLSMLRGLALAPTLLLVDDADLMDPESRALLRAMAPRLPGTGLRVVATRLGAPDQPVVGLEVRRLEALDDDDAFELLAAEAGPAADEGTLRILVQQSGGLPRDLLDALRSLTADQLRGREPLLLPLRRTGDPHALGDDPGWRGALELVALAPRMPRALSQLVGIPHDTLDELLGNGMLEQQAQTIRIASPVRRSRIIGTLERPERLRRHRRLAQAASAAGVPWATAWHESFVAPEGAGPRLLRAGIELAGELDVRAAVELAERALRLYGSAPEDLDSLLELSAALLRAGEPAIASRLLQHARLEGADPTTAMHAVRLNAAAYFARTHHVPVEELEGAVGLYGPAVPDDCAGLLATAASFHLVRGELAPARSLLQQARPFLPTARPGTVELHREVDALADAVEGIPVRARVTGPDAVDRDADARQLVAVRTLSLTEHYDLARQGAFVLLQRLGGTDLHVGEVARFLAAENEIRAGDVGRAREAAQRWVGTAVHRPRTASRLMLEAWLAFASGRADDARDLGELCLRRAAEEGDHAVTARLLAFQGEAALIAGDADEAVRLLRMSDLAAAPIRNPGYTRHAADLVHGLVRLGRMREADAVAGALRARRADRPSRWLTLAIARIAALLAPDERAAERYEEAIAAFGPDDSRFDLAKTLLGRADLEARLGRPRDRAATLAAARSALEQAGAWAWSAPTAADAVPAPVSDGPELTPDEAEVLRLVRLGYRNKEIARTLFVSLRTVELRMTHIFRKTGAASRAQLIAPRE
jgi:DNA-binding CsgD family transcriptional regulator